MDELESQYQAEPETLYTPVAQIPSILDSLQPRNLPHRSGGEAKRAKQATPSFGIPMEKRKELIQNLQNFLADPARRAWVMDAEARDLRRPKGFSEKVIMGCIASCKVALAGMDEWCANKLDISDVPAPNPGSRAARQYVRREPRGVALIIGTWNFPLPLLLKPLISAVAAGCPTVCKLSEVSVKTSLVLKKMIEEHMDPKQEYIKCVFGGIPQATELLNRCGNGVDIVFYTGNTTVGRAIYMKCAEGLVPCILELGGKNPVLVTKSCDLNKTVRKLVDAKFQNAGQFCVSPDHVLIQKGVDVAAFKKEVEVVMLEYYGDDAQQSPAYSRIVHGRHWDRLNSLLSDSNAALNGTTTTSVTTPKCSPPDRADLFIPPTFFWDPPTASRLLKEEIFGPLLPILTPDSELARDHYNSFETIQDMVECVNRQCTAPSGGTAAFSGGAPLALYLCCGNGNGSDSAESEEAFVMAATRSGGVCVNDFMLHMLNESLPFGGLGHSGFGNYHGEWGVKAFQHERAVMVFGSEEFTRGRYPDHAKAKASM